MAGAALSCAVLAACGSDGASDDAVAGVTAAPPTADGVTSTASAGTPVPGSVGSAPTRTTQPPGSEECLYTDPGRVDISVLQARTCPDGTTVSVRGTVVADGDDRWLCDSSAATDAASCQAAGLLLVGDLPPDGRSYAGVIVGDELRLAPSAPG